MSRGTLVLFPEGRPELSARLSVSFEPTRLAEELLASFVGSYPK